MSNPIKEPDIDPQYVGLFALVAILLMGIIQGC